MSNENQETIAEIVAQMRLGVKDWRGERVGVFDCFADRIEAAHKRERDAGAEAAKICGEIGEMIGREEVCKKLVTNCNRFGNAAKMREALDKADAALSLISKSAWFIDANFAETKAVIDACNAIEASLAELPRNCDVGTAEEQVERFQWFCDTRPCDGCTLKNKVNETLDCAIHWAQMSYKEGGPK